MGVVRYFVEWDWAAADAELSRALVLGPGNAYAIYVKAGIAGTLGHFAQSLQLSQRAVELDPLYAWNYAALGEGYRWSGNLAPAEAADRKALELNKTGAGLHVTLAYTLITKGEASAALAEVEKETDAAMRQVALPLALDALGRSDEAKQNLAIAEQQYAVRQAYWIAVVYARPNDLNQAFAWLDRARRQRDPILIAGIQGEPMLNGIRADGRYKGIIKQMDLSK
jgi:tetratricopeptide (TPR) repeat protein